MLKIDPIIDFNEYVNGKWLNSTKLPKDKSSWGTFDILRENNLEKLGSILENLSKDNINENKIIGDIYNVLINQEYNKNNEIKKLEYYLKFIEKIKTFEDLGIFFGFMEKLGMNPFFNVHGTDDPKDTRYTKLTLWVSDLSLPSRDYYLKSKFDNIKVKFKKHIKECFDYFSIFDNLDKNKIADDIVTLETLIANIHRPVEENRSFDKLYTKTTMYSFIDLMSMTSDKILKVTKKQKVNQDKIKLMWKNYFNVSSINNAEDIIIFDIIFFRKITILLQLMPLNTLIRYIQYNIIKNMAYIIIDDLDKIFFNFYGKVLNGIDEITERQKRIVTYLDLMLGKIIGKDYVDKYFSNNSKSDVLDIVNNIKKEMELSIKTLVWMSDKTKEKALKKLSTFKTKIGYPEVWEDHSKLLRKLNHNFQKKTLVDIFNGIRYYNYDYDILQKIDKLRDPHTWSMNPQDVNAYYSPRRNEIVFPAGILQKPFFDKDSTLCENYGGIGTVIAHEITHGYDDQGRKYDENGNIKNWWDKDDIVKFNKIANKMIEQYANYKIQNTNINGELTLGENLADLGALTLAYRALNKCKVLSKKDKQYFFISYANLWKRITTPENIISNILSDPHSPPKFRVFMVRNIDEFYEAFVDNESKYKNAKDSMYLEKKDRIKMW